MRNLSTGIEASATGESLNSGDVAVHPAARRKVEVIIAAVAPVAVVVIVALVVVVDVEVVIAAVALIAVVV